MVALPKIQVGEKVIYNGKPYTVTLSPMMPAKPYTIKDDDMGTEISVKRDNLTPIA